MNPGTCLAESYQKTLAKVYERARAKNLSAQDLKKKLRDKVALLSEEDAAPALALLALFQKKPELLTECRNRIAIVATRDSQGREEVLALQEKPEPKRPPRRDPEEDPLRSFELMLTELARQDQ